MANEISTLRDVLADQLKDLYSAETLITKALPKMAKAATAPDLKAGFKHHLEQTKVHVERIKSICAELGVKPTGKTCQATVGLIKEGDEAIEEDASSEMKDLLLIAAARRVEHYEMSAYTSAAELATASGLSSVAQTLKTTLGEEEATDTTLAKATKPAIASAKKAERTVEPEDDAVTKVTKAVKKVVKKVTA